MSSRNKTKSLTYNAILIAITILVGSVPQLGFIQIPGIPAVTVMHIPVIIAGILFGTFSSFLASFAFGVTSMFVAMSRGIGFDLLFMNPLVSILPRLAFGIFVGMMYSLISKLKINDKVSIGLTAFISSLFHSVVVLIVAFIAMGFSEVPDFLMINKSGFWVFIVPILFGVFLEAIAAVIISIPVVLALRRVVR